jgi:hypothetical protein
MLTALLASLALFLSAASALVEDWPSKPITVLTGFPAGSGVDVVARMLQRSLEKSLGQRPVLDYKTGAGGNVASEVVTNVRPDGTAFLRELCVLRDLRAQGSRSGDRTEVQPSDQAGARRTRDAEEAGRARQHAACSC